MTHGVTNRMTGGGTGRCLQTTEAGGMGEGWSDTMAKFVPFFFISQESWVSDMCTQLEREDICRCSGLRPGTIRY